MNATHERAQRVSAELAYRELLAFGRSMPRTRTDARRHATSVNASRSLICASNAARA